MPSVTVIPAIDPVVGDRIQLVDGNASVTIAPQRGGLVTSFRVDDRELLYLDEATLRDASKNVRGGIPVLFPAPGKLVDDRWQSSGAHGVMKQHGFARNYAWTRSVTVPAADGGAKITLGMCSNEQTRAQYPWDFAAELDFSLKRSALTIALRVHNQSPSVMPFAFGLHPYFHVLDKAHASIDTQASRVFDNVTKQAGPFRGFDLSAPELDLHLLDHGSTSSALHFGDGASICIRGSQDLGFWVVWTLAGKDFVCLEPWTSPGNALNTGEKLLRVEPGEQHESRVEIALKL